MHLSSSRAELVCWLSLVAVPLLTAACGQPSQETGGKRVGETATVEGTIDLKGQSDNSGALVEIGSQGTRTSEDGSFSFEEVQTGRRAVAASAEGFQRTTRIVDVSNPSTSVELTLQPEDAENSTPVVASISTDRETLEPGQSTTITVSASDPDGDDLGYEWSTESNFEIADGDNPSERMVTAPDAFGVTGTIRVTVSDGNGASASAAVGLSTKANEAPTVVSVTASEETLAPGGSTSVKVEASDPDGDELAYRWSADGSFSIESSSGAEATVTAPDQADQQGNVSVTVEDGNGNSASGSIRLTTSNEAPTISSVSADPPQLERGGSATLRANASDPDGDELSYTWRAESSDWSIQGQGESAELQAPDAYGASTTVTVTVSDGRGASTSAELSVSTVRSAGSPVISSLTASPSTVEPGGTIQLQVSASDPDGESLTYTWQAPSDWTITENGDSAQVVAPDEPGQRASIAVTVTAESGQQASASVFVSTRANSAPVVASIVATPNPVAPGATTTVDVSASDADGDSLSYNWTEPNNWTRQSASNNELVLEAPDTYGASGTLEVEVDDGRAMTQTSVTLSTTANLAPTISNLSARPSPVSRGGTVQLAASANDPNGDDLSYTWRVGHSDWTLADASKASTSLDAPDQAGSSTSVMLTVEDGAGGQAEASTSVATLDCGANRGNCDGSATNGCETNLMSNASHCGACGQRCSSGAKAQSVCFGGSCDVQCATGFADCDGDSSNGCEVDLNNDDANCGSCGNTCGGFANASSTCQNGQCQLNCKSGFANCDGRISNGCEVDLSDNDNHCGQCGNVCGSASNGDRVCQSGDCELTCDSGFEDCDGNPANGCEAQNGGASKQCPGTTCNQILQDGYSDGTGTYWLKPGGSSGTGTFEVYCDMDTNGGGWTLIESCDRPTCKGPYSGQGYGENFPRNVNQPTNFSDFRFSRQRMIELRNQSTRWRATCNLNNDPSRDFALVKFSNFDPLTESGSKMCRQMDSINIRDYSCQNCQVAWWNRSDAHLHVDSSNNHCGASGFNVGNGSVRTEDNWGLVAYNQSFQCYKSKSSTSNYWVK